MTARASTKVFGIEKYESTLVVTPQGDASGYRYTDIHRDTNSICDLIDRDSVQNIIVDFSDVGILGSIIISSIIKIARKISERDGHACFCQASESMCDVIQSMSLTKLWPYYDTLDEAVGSFEDPSSE